ncbi:type II secretion system F family protein [Candidatus Altiarchaeota archaeon]
MVKVKDLISEEGKEQEDLKPKRKLKDTMAYKALGGPISAALGALIWALTVVLQFVMMIVNSIQRVIHPFMLYLPDKVADLFPTSYLGKIDQDLIYAGLEMRSEKLISILIIYSIVSAGVGYSVALVLKLSDFITAVITIIIFAAMWVVPRMLLSLLIYRRTENIESVLPDILDIISQNMIAGMTSYNALWSASRPEFGPLAVEIQTAAKATLTGEPFEESLVKMSSRIDSEKLERTVRLIIQGMRSGGELPAVLSGISKDMRDEINLKKQMATEANAHSLFILFALVIGAPLLLAVSLQFITIFHTLFQTMDLDSLTEQGQAGMITISAISVTPDFFYTYAVLTLIILALFGSLLIGLMRTGKVISGIVNIPIFVIISVVVFLVLNAGLTMFFGSMFTAL